MDENNFEIPLEIKYKNYTKIEYLLILLLGFTIMDSINFLKTLIEKLNIL